ncbi:MAG: potassium channel family protein [Methyloceanibacter sp.]|uniref:potassium channel family protein n=1 Tax=Methyloceanibacter sp. TaxID=1965321 RepID=UPI003C3DA1FE
MKEFVVFVRHFFSILMMVRHVLAALLALIAMGAGLISIAEGMNYWEALYLTLITGLTVGYGDLAPTTVLGRIVSVLVALIGLVFFGIVVAVANRAIVKTLEEQRSKQQSDNR